MLRCKNCYLWRQSRNGVVFSNFTEGIGNKNSKIMLILDTPLYSDILKDKLFSDYKYKNIFNKLLDKGNINIDNVYITTYLKCLPTDKSKKPTKIAKEKCFSLYLDKEIKSLKPRVIILCGSLSCNYLIEGFTNVKTIIGKYFYSDKYKCYLIPIYNPQYLSNFNSNSFQFKKMSYALTKVNQLIDKSKKKLNLTISSNYTQLKNMGNIIGVDLETTSLDWQTGKIITIGISDIKNTLSFDLKEINWKEIIPELQKRKLIFQNGIFDCLFFKNIGFNLENSTFSDTRVMQYLLNATLGNSLGFMVQYYFQYSYKDTIDVSNIIEHKPEERKQRCGTDAYFTIKLFKLLYQKLQEKESLKSLKVYMLIFKVVIELQYKGILVDVNKMKEIEQYYIDLISKEEQLFNSKGKITEIVNLKSHKQLKELIFSKWKLPIINTTKSGEPSCNEESLSKLVSKKSVLKHLLKYREYSGHLAKVSVGKKSYKNYVKEDNRIHGEFNMFSPNSSRLMMRKPNCQQIPRKSRLKEIFITPKDYSFVYFDFSQLEFRIWVHLANDKKAIEFINSGKDIHRWVAGKFYRISEDKVTKEQRDRIKTVVYGTAYGRTPEAISMSENVPIEEAENIQRIFFSLCKTAYFWFKKLENQVLKDKYIKTPFGTYRYFDDIDLTNKIKKEEMLREAKNFIIQSWAVELVFIAMYKVWKKVKEEKLDAYFIMQQHDMGMLEVLDSQVDKVKKIILNYAQNPIKLSIPIDVEIKTGKSWGDLKT